MSSQPTAVLIKGPSLGAILSVLGDAALNTGGLKQGARVELGGGAGALLVQGVSKSSGMDVTTVVVEFISPVASALIIEWFKTRLAARRPPTPDKPLPPITVVVGDLYVSSE